MWLTIKTWIYQNEATLTNIENLHGKPEWQPVLESEPYYLILKSTVYIP